MDLTTRLDALADRIAALPGAEPPFVDPFPAEPEALDDAESQLGRPLPEPLRSFYTATDGLDLRWTAHDTETGRAAEGVVGIVDLALALEPARAVPRLGAVLGPGGLEGPWLLFEALPNRHDVLVGVGDNGCRFVLVLPDGSLLDLDLTAEAYLDRALSVGGLYGWHLRSAPDASAVLRATSDDRFFENAETFFPDADLAPFRHRELDGVPDWPLRPVAAAFDAAFGEGPTVAERAAPVGAAAVRRAEMAWGHPMPPGLRALYGGLDGCEVRWTGADDDRGASFRLLSLEEAAGGPDWMTPGPWDHDAARQVGAPPDGPLAAWLPLLISEGLDAVWRPDRPALGVVDGADVREVEASLDDLAERVVAPGGPVPWLRDLS